MTASPIELFYLDLDKPLLVYQRRGGLDAVRDTTVQARERGHDEAVRLCERAVGVIEAVAQDAAEARYTAHPERRQQAAVQESGRRVRSGSAATPPVRSRRVAHVFGGAWAR